MEPTPGPWKWFNAYKCACPGAPSGALHSLRLAAEINGKLVTILRAKHDSNIDADQDIYLSSEDNGQLLAAAPQLLETCQYLLEWCGLPPRPNQQCILCCDLFGNHMKDCPVPGIEAAVAKATKSEEA